MKTRTLLLLAVACGLVILVAGSIKLFLIADDTAPAHLSVGESAKIGDMMVTVVSARREGAQTLVTVALQGVDDPDGALTFFYGVGANVELRPVAPGGADTACAATRAAAVTNCVLAFDTATNGVLRYERAGQPPARWDIAATS